MRTRFNIYSNGEVKGGVSPQSLAVGRHLKRNAASVWCGKDITHICADFITSSSFFYLDCLCCNNPQPAPLRPHQLPSFRKYKFICTWRRWGEASSIKVRALSTVADLSNTNETGRKTIRDWMKWVEFQQSSTCTTSTVRCWFYTWLSSTLLRSTGRCCCVLCTAVWRLVTCRLMVGQAGTLSCQMHLLI